jgi:FkbM family methyltransferase
VDILRSARGLVEKAFGIRIVGRHTVPFAFAEEHLRRFINHFEVDCIFDVGANTGQYYRLLRSKLDYAGAIISYEPIPELAAQMRKLASEDDKWFIEELALDEWPGTATLNIFANDQFSSLHEATDVEVQRFERETKFVRKIEVRTTTLRDELDKYKEELKFRCPFLKIDTQGHDLSVARGAGDQIQQFVGVQAELSIKRIYADTPTIWEALQFYRDRGFEVSALVPNNPDHFPELIEIDCIMFRSNLVGSCSS